MSATAKHTGRPGSKFNPTEVDGVVFNVSPKGAVTYCIRYYDELHKRRTVVVGRDFEQSKVKLAEVTVAHSKGESTANMHITLAEVIAEWRGTRVLNPVTAETYDFVIDRYVAPYFALKLKDVRVPAILKWDSRLKGQGISGSYRRNIWGAFSVVLSFAVQQEHITTNWIRLVPKSQRPRPDGKEKVILTPEGEQRTFANITGSKSRRWLADYMVVALAQALRIGEVCGLQWTDFDFDNRTLTIARQVNRNGRYLERDGSYILPKWGKVAAIGLTDATYDLLHPRYLAWRISGSTNPWVFTDASGEPRKSSTVSRAWHVCCGEEGATFHSLRHTCCSRLVNSGKVPISVASRYLRHSSITVTETYIHADPSKASDDLAAINAALAA